MTSSSDAVGRQNGVVANGTAKATTNGAPRTKICVYCGASAGGSPAHMEMARELARVMAANNIDLGTSTSLSAPRARKLPSPSRRAHR